MKDIDLTVEAMNDLNAAGVQLAIDDFGTGYSSLSCLKHFPIKTLKIDQSFVRHMAVSADDAAIVAATIAMAHTLRLRVVAEGVEEEAQMRFLQKHGCDEVQGHLISAPMPADVLHQQIKDGLFFS
jgi:EAL domain-containing protein (putative c-di-GMP-specific phosphodiesterase class I)